MSTSVSNSFVQSGGGAYYPYEGYTLHTELLQGNATITGEGYLTGFCRKGTWYAPKEIDVQYSRLYVDNILLHDITLSSRSTGSQVVNDAFVISEGAALLGFFDSYIRMKYISKNGSDITNRGYTTLGTGSQYSQIYLDVYQWDKTAIDYVSIPSTSDSRVYPTLLILNTPMHFTQSLQVALTIGDGSTGGTPGSYYLQYYLKD